MPEQPDLATEFLRACAVHGPRIAVHDNGTALSYTEFAARVLESAGTLDDLLGDGRRRIGLHAANSADYLIAYYALLATGRLPFLVDASFGATELGQITHDCGIDAYLTDRPAFPLPAATRPIPGSGLALAVPDAGPPATAVPEPGPTTGTCRFTSGTTGRPKCLEFSHAAVLGAAGTWTAGTGLTTDDRVLCLAAFSNGLAFNTSLLPVFLAGAQLHLFQGLPTSGRITRAVRRAGATRLIAFPLVYRLLAEATEWDPDAFATVTRAVSAAAVLDPAVRTAFESRYGVPVADYYGVAETGPCTFERDPQHRTGLGSALPGVALRIVERPTGEPEVWVRTPSMADRYLNAPGALEERTDSDGFYATGDTGRIDEGRLYITGRISGPINLAGRKVDPVEIEALARGLDGVEDSTCFADHDARGETVLHLVVAGTRHPHRTELIRACRDRLAPYKVPGRISFLPAIPRSAAGKVRLSELTQLLQPTNGAEEPRRQHRDGQS
ncbi:MULTISPECIES: class I adenylate-forming enzyme family protein [unclassified Streptomyces]|uniref:class I adenylate-forming enzyme family protein n=1 Tax=unclassified Streptomyces TaxID=2593676 RepID=UPI0022545BCF|nr:MULTISPECIES: class I adenylate-forming enzyme family protein [unclassified Streptomyces]MCX4409547.1 acyl--CoA ligase [Streptomyces sp. NBC_01764]MCX5191318.1 acyl--CoA ligase [Streptomyces sp. NBC_00268]